MSEKVSKSTFYGLSQGESYLVIGPPGTGKSWFAASICEVVPPERTLLLATKPREITSYGYRKHGLDKRAELFVNEEWDPDLDLYKHDAYRRLMKRLSELRTDDSIDAVILDTGTDAGLLIGQHVLGPHKCATPGELSDPRSYYQTFTPTANRFVKRLVSLTYGASPKFVVCTWHAQPPKEGDSSGAGVTYEGAVLPALEGSYREQLAGDFSVVVYSKLAQPGKKFVAGKMQDVPGGYQIQVRADKERHAKVASLPAFEVDNVSNEFSELYKLMVEEG